MDLESYFKKENIEKQVFAKSIGFSPTYISLVIHKKRIPSFKLAKAIIEATQGKVTVSDLFASDSPLRYLLNKTEKE